MYENKLKFLGIIIDKTLSFENQKNFIISKITKTIGIFYNLRNCSSKTVLISLYSNLIYACLIYGNFIRGNTYQVHINRIFILQKKAVSIISYANYRAHSSLLFLENNLLKIQEINLYNVAVY